MVEDRATEGQAAAGDVVRAQITMRTALIALSARSSRATQL